MATQVIADGGPDGTKIGNNATYTIGFYGVTPVVKQTSVAIVANTAAASISATQWGFSTSTQPDAITASIRNLHTILNNYGLQ